MNQKLNRIIVYGGTGFVGVNVAKQLVARGASVTCVSRRGLRPVQLANREWADRVSWLKGDAGAADPSLLSAFDVIISTVGSPPIPTLSQAAYDKQLAINGACNVKAIESAAQAGIKRLVLVGAKLPKFLQSDRFAYAKGKRLALEAAQEFSKLSDEHRGVVIQPGGVFGTRYTASGTRIPLGAVMGPLSKVMSAQFVAVEKLAKCIADSALCSSSDLTSFKLIKNDEI